MALLAQNTFTIRRLAKDELNLVFSSDTLAIPSKNGVADLSTAEFRVKVTKGGRELFPAFDEEIGGRNLLVGEQINVQRGSAIKNIIDKYHIKFIKETPIDDDHIMWNGTQGVVVDVFAGEYVTFSAYYKSDFNGNVRLREGVEIKVVALESTNDNWVKVTITTKAIVDNPRVWIYFMDYRTFGQYGTFEVLNWKLEKGNKATDWTPAPEDILSNAILTAHNCTAVVDGDKIKLTSIEDDKDAGYVDVTVAYGEGNNVTRRFTWARAETGVSITNVDVEYAVNNNTSTAPTTGWSTLPPISLTSGQQLWMRTVTSYSTGSPTYSIPANITPQVGQGVESITEEYAISTSKTAQPTTGWSTTQPTWVQGQYIWSRVKVVYKNPSSTVYTGYAVSSEWEAINELEIGGRNLLLKSKDPKTGTSYRIGGWTSSRDFIVGETLTVTIKGNIPGTRLFGLWFNNGSIGTGSIPKIKDGYYSKQLVVPAGVTSKVVGLYLVGNQTAGDNWEFEWIKLESGTKPTDWTPAPEDVQAEIDSAKQEALTAAGNAQTSANTANTAIGNLNTYVDGSFKDGVIEASEAKAIEKYINIVNTEKSNLEATYNTLYTNTYLEGTPKTTLLNAKVTYFGAVDTLLGSINTAISDGKTTTAEKNAVDSNYNSYKSALASLQTAIENANKAIQTKLDALSTEKVENIEIGGRNLIHNSYPNDEGIWNHNSGAAVFSISEGEIKIKGTGTGWKHYELNTNNGATFLNSLKEGYYTISGEVKIGDDNYDGNAYISFRIGNDSSTQTQASISNESLTTEWQKISGTRFMSQEVLDSASFRRILLIANGLGTVSFRKIKLERGTKATDWTPAPEDIQYDYEAEIKNAADSISLAVYNKTLDELNPATELKLTSSSIKLTVADDIATAKNEAISAAATDATNKVNGLKADLSGTGIDIEAGILTLYSGVKGGNAGGKVIIAGDNFSVDADGKLKAVDGEFSGKITAIEGEIGGFEIVEDMLASLNAGMKGAEKGATEPAFWGGGTYNEAKRLMNLLDAIRYGGNPVDKTANFVVNHSGAAKLGIFIIDQSGKVNLVDPILGKSFGSIDNAPIPSYSDMMLNEYSESSAVNSGKTFFYNDNNILLPNSVTTVRAGGDIEFTATATFSGGIPAIGSAYVELILRRNGVYYQTIYSDFFERKKAPVGTPPLHFTNTVEINEKLTDVPHGVYDILFKSEYIMAANSCKLELSESSLIWAYTPKDTKSFQIGNNGFMAWFGADKHIHLSETEGLNIKGITTGAVTTAFARVTSNGAMSGSTSYLRDGLSLDSSKIGTGRYRLTHNLNKHNYVCHVTPTHAARSASISIQDSNYISIEFRNEMGALADSSFSFSIIEHNN